MADDVKPAPRLRLWRCLLVALPAMTLIVKTGKGVVRWAGWPNASPVGCIVVGQLFVNVALNKLAMSGRVPWLAYGESPDETIGVGP